MNKYVVSVLSPLVLYIGMRGFRSLRKYFFFKELSKEAAVQKKIMSEVLFFGNSDGECSNHLLKKGLCYNMDCPLRKLRFILDTLEGCRKTLDICIHLLTSVEISNSLITSHKRGIRVRIICDNEMSTNKGSQVHNLSKAGISVKIPILNYHMHSKITVIDGWKVMTGSTNWTVQGIYGNWDNLLVTTQPDIVRESVTAFNLMWNHPKVQMFC